MAHVGMAHQSMIALPQRAQALGLEARRFVGCGKPDLRQRPALAISRPSLELHEQHQQPGAASALVVTSSTAAFLTALVAQRAGRRHWRRQLRSSPKAEGGSKGKASDDTGGSWWSQAGIFGLYFIAQTGMGVYMKQVLSAVRVGSTLRGVPAPFYVAACQQATSLLVFGTAFLVLKALGRPWSVRRIEPKRLWLVFLLGACFSANIGTNLLSMSLVPLSLTMVIRACSPLTTALVQSIWLKKDNRLSLQQWACMLIGVACATICVIAQSGSPTAEANSAFFFGVAMSAMSIVAGACDYVIKAKLGSDLKLSAVETTLYNAPPVLFFCLLAGSIISKPVSKTWATVGTTMTDMGVFKQVIATNPWVFLYLAGSGLLAVMYNTYTTYVIQSQSPATTAFAGNFNKAVSVLVVLLIFEKGGAPGLRGWIVRLSVVGSIASFTAYNIISKRRKKKAAEEAKKSEEALPPPPPEKEAEESA